MKRGETDSLVCFFRKLVLDNFLNSIVIGVVIITLEWVLAYCSFNIASCYWINWDVKNALKRRSSSSFTLL